ncbi:MAG: glycosyltransferase [Planctomycetia bacterium]|nr:glycosyltransferase [Planctomycetia bacterium]
MPIHRVAVIFDNTARPDTTGIYCRRALGQLVEVEHFLPTEFARLQKQKFDLYLAIDDGLSYLIPGDLRPSAYWAIDTHMDFERELRRAQTVDFVFAAQKDGALRLRERGISNAMWLPLACDPEIHAKHNLPKQFDISFVGNLFPGPREDLLRLIHEKFPNSFIGQRFFMDMACTYSESRIVFNRSLRNDINMRVFEALASGSLLLTNDLRSNGQDELFRDGIHLATYRDPAELLEKIDFYLREEALREEIAERGRQAVLARHTYLHRMRTILDSVARPISAQPTESHAEPAQAPTIDYGKTSIILATCGQLEYTRLCLDSIRSRTPEDFELIVVDNGSTDGTVEFLRSCADVTLILNFENRGFPAAANQGMLAATGRNILLLNNDTVVTTKWLERLLAALHSDPSVGLVGPCSNNISGEQQVSFSYDRLEGIDPFAQQWAVDHHRQTIETDRLVGFCLLIRREVIDKISLLDERFGIGNFEDDDLCRRARQAGYRACIACDAFVHHFGSRTFLASGIDFGKLLDENRRKFEEKWRGTHQQRSGNGSVADRSSGGQPQPPPGEHTPAEAVQPGAGRDSGSEIQPPCGPPFGTAIRADNTHGSTRGSPAANGQPAAPIARPTVPIPAESPPNSDAPLRTQPDRPRFVLCFSPAGDLLLKRDIITLSLCMIERDNETTIGAALESIRPWVDEIVVVDTGSKDKTPEICRQYGARLLAFPWCDDFSAARNESLKHARGRWIFWMDSDDTISAECGQKLRTLADGPHQENTLGYIVQVHCPGAGDEGNLDVTAVDHVKLIRNRPDLRFEGRIHEQLLPAIRRAGGDVAWTDIYVRHSGSDHSPEGFQRKLERDLRILHRELEETPTHPFVLFNLGMTYADAKRYDEAIGYLERCLTVSTPDESHLRKAYALLVSSLSQAGRYDDAWASCQRGLSLYPDDKELLFRSAMVHHHFGRLADAEETYLRVLNGEEPRHFSSIDQGLAGFKTRHNLAIVYDDMGRLDKAEEQWRLIVSEVPNYRPAWRGLTEVLLNQGRTAALSELVNDARRRKDLAGEARLIVSRMREQAGDIDSALRELDAAETELNGDDEPLRRRCRMLFERVAPEAAEGALERLVACDPDDAAAYHNLGTAYLNGRKYSAAARSFRRSLDLRPDSPATKDQLQLALEHSS